MKCDVTYSFYVSTGTRQVFTCYYFNIPNYFFFLEIDLLFKNTNENYFMTTLIFKMNVLESFE